MNKYKLKTLAPLCLLLILTLSSCAAIGTIFKAGVWVGIVVVVIILVVIFWIINKTSKK
ncbi:MAG: hypothetical protein ABI148_05850 [Ginsengibacter sp.]